MKDLTNQRATIDSPRSGVDATVSRLGFSSALLTAVFAAAFFAVGIVTPVRTVPYPYVAAFFPADYVWMYPAFLLAPTLVVLAGCIYAYAAPAQKLFGRISLSFAVVYATVITIDYFVQLTVIAPSISTGETANLALFTQYNPHGVFVALESLGYLALQGTLFFTAAIFSGGRLERAL